MSARFFTRTIEEVTSRIIDYRGKTPEKTQEGVRLITAKVVKDGRILDDPAEFIAEEGYDAWMRRGLPEIGDVLITTEAPLGEVAMLRNKRVALAQRIILLRGEPTVIDQDYLFHALRSEFVQGELAARATGTTVSGIKQSELRRVRVPLYALPVQQKIAAILSAYDDLIENNLRRIRILEEMAQALYREWFVEYRFPGRERVRLVDSPLGNIPEGWEVTRLAEVASVIDCLHSKKPERDPAGSGVLLQLENIGERGEIDLSTPFLISDSDYARWSSRIELTGGDLVITNVGRVAAVGRVPLGVRAAPGRNMTAVRLSSGRLTAALLLEYFLSPHKEAEVQRRKDSGALMDAMNVRAIYEMNVPVPPPGLVRQFDDVARPARELVEILVASNQALRRTRDLLLPRLISGEVDVSDLEIAVPEAVA